MADSIKGVLFQELVNNQRLKVFQGNEFFVGTKPTGDFAANINDLRKYFLSGLVAGSNITINESGGLFTISSTGGGGGGSGTVTEVSGLSPLFTVTNPTTTPTFNLISQSANRIFASPDSISGVASFRALVVNDIPNLPWSKITSGKPTTLAGYGITDAYPLTGNPSNFVDQAGARSAISLTTLGTSGAATYNSTTGVLNIPNYTTGGGGSTTFIGLTDVPASYTGNSLKLVRVNSGETALEFFTSPYLTGNQTITLTGDVTGSGATSIATTVAAIRNVSVPTLSTGYLFYNGTNFVFQSPSGSGTVNTGNQYQLGYYAANGTAISPLTLITGNRVLVSDSNGLPIASTVTDTTLGYLDATSSIQTQLNGKVSSVSGTANRITSTGGTTPVIDIAATYVGQSSITTVGTITSGIWNGSVIGSNYGGAGTVNGILKANGSGVVSQAIAGTDYLAPFTSPYQPLGTLITTNWANLTGWTTFGAPTSITVASNELVLTNTVGSIDLNSGIRNSGYGSSNYEDILIDTNIRVGTINSTSFGVGFSFYSQHGNTPSRNSVLIAIGLATGNLGQIIYYGGTGGTITATNAKTSPAAATITSGDVIRVVIRYIGNKFITTLYGGGTNKVINTFTYHDNENYTYTTDFPAPNYYQHAIHALGGTHYVSSGYTVSARLPKRADLMVVGDSITKRIYTHSSGYGYAGWLENFIDGKVIVYAGLSNRTDEINVAEIIAAQPQRIYLQIGTNNFPIGGDSAATFGTKYQAIVDALVTAGYVVGTTLFIGLLLPRPTYDVRPYNTELTNRYGTNGFYVDGFTLFRNGTATTFNPLYTTDGVHPNTNAQKIFAEAIFNVLYPNLAYTPKISTDFTPAFFDPNGYMMIGGNLGKTVFPLSVISQSTASTATNFHVSNDYDNGGLYLAANTSGFLLGSNSNYNGTQHIAKSATPSVYASNSLGHTFYFSTGQTAGNSYSLQARLNVNNLGTHAFAITTGASVLHVPQSAIGANDGLWIGTGNTTATGHIVAGGQYDGTNWTARATSATIYNITPNGHIFYVNSGLTNGNNFTPTELARVDPFGNYLVGFTPTPTSLTKSIVIGTGGAFASVDIAAVALTGQLRNSIANTDGLVITAGQSTLKTQHIFSDFVGIGTITPTANLNINQAARSSNWVPSLLVAGGAHTGITASTELIGVDFNMARTVQFATGGKSVQREIVLRAPTYSAVGATTIQNAATISITGAPVAGTNMTITNSAALAIETGKFSHYNITGTNFESTDFYWSGNSYFIGTNYSGTGTYRDMRIGAANLYLQNQFGDAVRVSSGGASGYLTVTQDLGVANLSSMGVSSNNTGTSGVTNQIAIVPSINQTSTAGYRGLWISPREVTTGSGIKYLIDAGTNSAGGGTGTHTSKFIVDNAGNQTLTGNINTASTFKLGTTDRYFELISGYAQIQNIDPSGNTSYIRTYSDNTSASIELNTTNSGVTRKLTIDSVVGIRLDSDKVSVLTGYLSIDTAGGGLRIKEGTNATMGRATLVSGTVTVNTNKVTATSEIFLTNNNPNGTVGFYRVSARVAGTSFTITSSSLTDTSDVSWIIIEPA